MEEMIIRKQVLDFHEGKSMEAMKKYDVVVVGGGSGGIGASISAAERDYECY